MKVRQRGNITTDHNVAHAHRYEAGVVDLVKFDAACFVDQQHSEQQQHTLVAEHDTCTCIIVITDHQCLVKSVQTELSLVHFS